MFRWGNYTLRNRRAEGVLQGTAALSALALFFIVSSPGRAQTNYNQVALQRWYGANAIAYYVVGSNPVTTVFDGSNMWVTNYGDGTVSKM